MKYLYPSCFRPEDRLLLQTHRDNPCQVVANTNRMRLSTSLLRKSLIQTCIQTCTPLELIHCHSVISFPWVAFIFNLRHFRVSRNIKHISPTSGATANRAVGMGWYLLLLLASRQLSFPLLHIGDTRRIIWYHSTIPPPYLPKLVAYNLLFILTAS